MSHEHLKITISDEGAADRRRVAPPNPLRLRRYLTGGFVLPPDHSCPITERDARPTGMNGPEMRTTIFGVPIPPWTAPAGIKNDDGKARWDLLPWEEVGQVVEVLTHGAKKYAPENWKRVPNPQNRYFAAAMRHLHAHRLGDALDDETGLPHLAHAACCILFLMHFEALKP